MLQACGGGSSGNARAEAASVASEPATDDAQTTDITGAILVERSADCADYANSYSSHVVDVNRSMGFNGAFEIEASADTCTISSNNIPNHDFNDGSQSFANSVAEVSKSLIVVRNPTTMTTVTQLSQQNNDAVLLNGVVVDLLSAGCWDASSSSNTPAGCSADQADWLIDPVGSDGFFREDSHNAHAQPDGSYHYHANPNALFDENPGPDGSPVIGFAADGFPIYGSFFLDSETGQVRKAISGYTIKPGMRPSGPGEDYDGFYVQDWEFTDSGDLDACNGMAIDEQYGYYVTDTYPWILGCFSGSPHFSFGK